MRIYPVSLLAFASIVSFMACNETPHALHPEYLRDIMKEVRQIDSAVNAIYGWEPRDSTFNSRTDTVVADMMNRYYQESIAIDSISNGRQRSYDQARTTWTEFLRLCEEGQFKSALDFYLAKDSCSRSSNAGDFIVHLKHSSNRYKFYSKVLYPLLRAYNDSYSADKEYIEVLSAEKVFEEMTILTCAEGNNYVPEVYPMLVIDLGAKLVEVDRIKDAVGFTGRLIEALYRSTGDALYSNFVGTDYACRIYLLADDHDNAIGTWEYFRTFLEDCQEDFDPKEFAIFRRETEKKIEAIRDSQQYSMAVFD